MPWGDVPERFIRGEAKGSESLQALAFFPKPEYSARRRGRFRLKVPGPVCSHSQ